MKKTVHTLILAASVTALLGGGVTPAAAGETGTAGTYNNVRLAKVWGTPKGKDVCISNDGKKNSGAVLVIRRCGSGSEQRWTLKGNSRGLYTIKNKKSAKCMGVTSKASGTQVKQYGCSPSSTKQQWALHASKILNKWSGTAITAETSKSGRKLTITKWNNSTSKRVKQEWGLK
ncbi:RICIN domain-containing protein [Streptomyces sp. A5-4]|uniref:RICIN domain-containing protein n=1 Tax=Streptomyces sp. A5-4 TaxID=3384771 RepID=UPI003DA81775